MRYWLTIFSIAVIISVGMVSVPTGVFALTFSPERFDTEVYPGVPIIEELTLLNETGTPVSVVLTPVELDLTNAESGRASFLLDTVGTPSVAWISVEPSQLVLDPGESRVVRVTLSAPAASAGSLIAGIATEFRPVRSDEEGDVMINAITGPFVFARVLSDDSVIAGHLSSFRLAEGTKWASSIPVDVEVSFANTGTVHLKPLGTIDVRNMFGRSIDQLAVNHELVTVLSGTTRELPVNWEGVVSTTEEPFSGLMSELKNPRLGLYTFIASVQFGDDSVETVQRQLVVFPLRSFVILGVVLVGIVAARRRLATVNVHTTV